MAQADDSLLTTYSQNLALILRESAVHTLWPLWGIALLFALAGRNESASILAALPWWHRAMGAAAAVAFFTGYLWRLIGYQ